MIIEDDPLIFDARKFLDAAQRAVRAVRRVSVGAPGSAPQVTSTGWLITADLLVVPRFVVDRGGISADDIHSLTFVSDSLNHPETLEQVPAAIAFADAVDQTDPVVLRLAHSFDGDQLTLAVNPPEPRENIFLLHHPGGRLDVQLSMGRILQTSTTTIAYDASTSAGSSGAPVFNSDWQFVAMHIGFKPNDSEPLVGGTSIFNYATTLHSILDVLKGSDIWPEIAATHRLVDVGAALRDVAAPTAEPTSADTDLLPAAVRWQFRPADVAEPVAARLRRLVITPAAEYWVLKPAQRARLVRSAGSLAALREARGDEPLDHPGQPTIDRILQGPPYPVGELRDVDLPYWLQAVRWFAPVVSDLPTPAEIQQQMARRRVRGRLTPVAAGFRGREVELKAMATWFAGGEGPIAVTGVGGIGKSALVASFALALSEDTLLLWLDFDYVDLAADDPASVVRQLFEQLTAQEPGIVAPSVDGTNWNDRLNEFATALAPRKDPPPLIVLDGFEIAQHAIDHHMIWSLFMTIVDRAPQVRVLVSGRAPVAGLQIGDHPTSALELGGLEPSVAKSWLQEAGITDPDVIDRTLQITHGVPLSLRLAVRLVQDGVDAADLPTELPERLVDGYLYRRILDRVVDPALKPIAQDALVLRRVDRQMMRSVLADRIPAELTVEQTFDALRREYGLIGNTTERKEPGTVPAEDELITLRSEVRQATLALLEMEDLKRVRLIDRRAADWYRTRPDELDDAARAELVYHLLRLGDTSAAEQAWRDESARFLVDAGPELPESAKNARAWLQQRTHDKGGVVSIEAWEADAVDRIRDLLSRGHGDVIREVLNERTSRSAASPLVLYDAWTAWEDADIAADLLDETGGTADPPAGGPLMRDRIILRAALAAQAGDRDLVEELLKSVQESTLWTADYPSQPMALAVVAARLRLTVDLPLEAELTRLTIDGSKREITGEILPATDALLPTLRTSLSPKGALEALGERLEIPLPFDGPDKAFAERVDRARRQALRRDSPLFQRINPTPSRIWLGNWTELPPSSGPSDHDAQRHARRIAQGAVNRWRLVTSTPLLQEAPRLIDQLSTRLERAIVGSLGAFHTPRPADFQLLHPVYGSFDRIAVRAWNVTNASTVTSGPRVDPTTSIRSLLTAEDSPWKGTFGDSWPQLVNAINTYRGPDAAWTGIALLLTSPDPLQELVRAVLGLPETYQM